VVDVPDVIMPFKFDNDQFRGLGLAEGQFCIFPLTLKVVLKTLKNLKHYRVRCDKNTKIFNMTMIMMNKNALLVKTGYNLHSSCCSTDLQNHLR